MTIRRGAGVEHARDLLAIAEAAGDLHLLAGVARQPGDQVVLHRAALARAVEVDDMGPGRARIGEALEGIGRIVGIDGRVFEQPLGKAHAAAADEVDGRIDQHDEKGLQKAFAGFAAALRVELGPEQSPLAHRSGDRPPIIDHCDTLRNFVAGVAVRKIGIFAAAQPRHIVANFEPAPAHVRHRPARLRDQPPHLALDEAEAVRVILLAALEEQLHAEADAEHRPVAPLQRRRAARARRSAPSHARQRRRRAARPARPRRSSPDRR